MPDCALQALLLRLEAQLLDPEVRRDAAHVAALLAEDFIEFGASGTVWSRAQVIAGLACEPAVIRAIEGFAIRPLADNLVLATYRCLQHAPHSPYPRTLRSSIWRRDAGAWRMAFHQGTRQ